MDEHEEPDTLPDTRPLTTEESDTRRLSDDEPDTGSQEDGPSWKILFPLLELTFVEAFNNNAIFAYLGYMMVFFGADSLDSAGWLAGLVASSYFAGQFVASFGWGLLADIFGRRNCLMLGSSITFISMIGFGLAPNIWVAVALRFVAGAGNGNAPLIKSIMANLTTGRTQSSVMGLLAGTWGLGGITGSLVGGLFANPAQRWQSFDYAFFRSFPFVIASWAAGLLLLIGVIACFLFLPPFAPTSKTRRTDRFAVVRDKTVLVGCLSYAMQGYAQTFLDELIPLWLISSIAKGGVAFSASNVGLLLGIGGATLSAGQFLLFGPVSRKLGAVNTYRIGVAAMVPACLLFPFVSFASSSKPAVWAFLLSLVFLRALCNLFAMASSYNLLNNSVDEVNLSSANGLGQSMVAFLRATAPLTAGPLFAMSIDGSRSMYWLSFVIIASVFVAISCFAFFVIPKALNVPKAEWAQLESRDQELSALDS